MNFISSTLSNTDINFVLLVVFYISVLIQLFYYLFFYVRVFKYSKAPEKIGTFTSPITVIIAAHNEAENLKQFLPTILEQDYPEFEVIVINDRSEDDTETILLEFQKKYPHLKRSFIKNTGKLQHGKKLAITLGIKAAKYEYILLTDADCQPISSQWIKKTANCFNRSEIVLSYGPYFSEHSFLNQLIRFDTQFIALQYFSFAKAGVPYMGIGRNLAYKKDLFIKNRGLASHAQMSSGDDDLFINEVATSKNTSVNPDPETFVYSIPKHAFKYWIRQKQRHFTTYKRYKTLHQFLLAGEVNSRVIFYLLFLILASSNFSNMMFWIFVGLKLIITQTVLSYNVYQLKEKKLHGLLIIFDFMFPFLNLFVFLVNRKNRKAKW